MPRGDVHLISNCVLCDRDLQLRNGTWCDFEMDEATYMPAYCEWNSKTEEGTRHVARVELPLDFQDRRQVERWLDS